MAATALPYETNQWSPFNKNGRKVYSKLFLLSLRGDPKSNEKPTNIPASILPNYIDRANKNKNIRKLKKRALQGSVLSPVLETPCSNDEDDLIRLNSPDLHFVESKIILPSKCVDKKNCVPKNELKQDAVVLTKAVFNLDYITDELASYTKNPESTNSSSKDPVNELANKNKVSVDGVSKGVPKLSNVPVLSKNSLGEVTGPPVQKLDTGANTAQGAQDVYIPKKPSQSTTTIPAPNSNLKVQQVSQPPVMNKTPPAVPTHNLYAGTIPKNTQTLQMGNHRQGQVIFQSPPTPFGPVPLQSPLHYGNPSPPIQYYNSSPNNYVHPAYPIPPTQPNVYQHPRVGGPQSHPIKNPNQVIEGAPIRSCTFNSMNVLEQYLNSNLSIEEVEQKIKASTPPSVRLQLITDGYASVLETSRANRLQTGYLFGKLLKRGILSIEDYSGSLEVLLKTSDELAIDVPRVWDYVAELVFPVLCEAATEMKNLHKLFNLLVLKPHAAKLLTRLFKLMIIGNEENGITINDGEENSMLTFAHYTTMATPPAQPSQLYEVLNKYLNERYSVQECLKYIKPDISSTEISQLVSVGTMSVLKDSKYSRLRIGFLFGQLLKLNIFSISSYCAGLEDIFKQADQLVIHVPKMWSCVAEVISPVICDNAINLRDLHHLFKLLGTNNNHAPELLHFLFMLINQEKGVAFLESIWKNSNLTFGDFMDESRVTKFVKQHHFQFLLKTDDSSLAPAPSLPVVTQSDKCKNKIQSIMDEPIDSAYSGNGSNSKTELLPIVNTAKMPAVLKKSCTGNDAVLTTDLVLHPDSQSNTTSNSASSTYTADPPNVAPVVLHSTEVISDELEHQLQVTLEGIKSAITTSSLTLGSQNFLISLNQIESLSIDTMNKLERIVELVFEKAVKEPDFSMAYALFFRKLALLKTPAGDGKTFVKFRTLLEMKCELEFEKQFVLVKPKRNSKVKEIEDCSDIEKRKDMQLDLDEYDKSLRMKSVALTKFIGELFKQGMLMVNIMVRCLNKLRDQKNEVSFECLCHLLRAVGKELESRKVDLNNTFGAMRYVVVMNPDNVISDEVRVMMKNVIDLRDSQWVPQKQDLHPKNDQTQEQAQQRQASDTPTPDENHGSKETHSYDKEVCDKLRELFKSGTSWCEIKVWIIQNVGERAKEDQFIRTLATACYEDSVDNFKLKADVLQKKYALLHQFLKRNAANELQCLYALEGFIDRLQHPPGLLLAICNQLYNEHIFSQKCLLTWKASSDSSGPEGKLKAIRELSSLFAGLNDRDGNSSTSSD